MVVYNKLVRDQIPDMIRAQGETPVIRILDTDEYLQHLETKLDEEVGEYHRDKNAEELADIFGGVESGGDSNKGSGLLVCEG